MNLDPEELVTLSAEIEKPMEAFLKWRQVADRYERGKKSKLAQICVGLRGEGKVSVAQLEMEAYATPEWIKYETEWDDAERKKVAAQVQYETLQNRFSAIQSALSYLRETMKRLG